VSKKKYHPVLQIFRQQRFNSVTGYSGGLSKQLNLTLPQHWKQSR
jgi:hypothetical protein